MLRTYFTGGLGQLWEYNFTVSLSSFSSCVQFTVPLYQVFSLFVFGCVLLSKTNCRNLCFTFKFLVFRLVLIKLENGFQKINLSSFSLGLILIAFIDD